MMMHGTMNVNKEEIETTCSTHGTTMKTKKEI
jgi:hypothetical protein